MFPNERRIIKKTFGAVQHVSSVTTQKTVHLCLWTEMMSPQFTGITEPSGVQWATDAEDTVRVTLDIPLFKVANEAPQILYLTVVKP